MSITEKIEIRENKALKLKNVLIRELSEHELGNINYAYYMIDSYIKSKENSAVGPIITYSCFEADNNGQAKVKVKIMVQLKSVIHNIEKPYELVEEIKVRDCLFARFNEKQENLQFAYQKLGVYAFENDIRLKGNSYTVFVKQMESDMVADIFMETMKGGDVFESL